MTLRRDRYRKNKKPPLSRIKAVWSACPNCGEQGPHFVPPSFGDKGFFTCAALPALTPDTQEAKK